MQKERVVAERALVFSNVFLDVLKAYVLKRVGEEVAASNPRALVVEESAVLESDGDRLKFLIRVICFSEIGSLLSVRLSQEILEEFSLPGFKIDIIESSPVSPS